MDAAAEARMTGTLYDVAIIGGGPGGYGAALYAANAGLSVALIEKDRPGGTCLHRGCIPAKALLETAHVARTVAHAAEFGIGVEKGPIDFRRAQKRKQGIVEQLARGLSGLLKQRRVELISGTGCLRGDGTVAVDGQRTIGARHIILAAGSRPRTLDLCPADGKRVLTSDEVLSLDKLPASAIIVGAGVVGLEFASMMTDLGVKVTVLEAATQVLPALDADVAAVLLKDLTKRGVDIRTGVTLTGCETPGASVRLSFEGGSAEAECVIVAIGRVPATEGLLDPASGVTIARDGAIAVDATMRTSAPGIYAIGDVVATPQLAHVAFAEAMVAVKDILGEQPAPIDYGLVPWCVYTAPEAAFVGVTEAQAKASGLDVIVKKESFAGNGRALILGESDGLIKVIAKRGIDGRPGAILGVHMVGPWVTEQLAAAYLAANWEATPDDVAPLIFPHPSLSEALGEAFIALTGRGLHLP
ncbi:MAG: dihydrolipoyl dehydrogenase [Rhizobiales bacterium]|nr:dihydrolipoyl dehydrogenase [Hyphomicrobiales bacterium]